MNSFEIDSIDKLHLAAEWVLSQLGKNRIIAFYGEMGSGKTTLIKEICHYLGCRSIVTSPTFSIVNEYPLSKDSCVYHFDFYRLTKKIELTDLGFEEYIYSHNYCFIEWPELGESLLPQETLKISLKVGEKQNRILTIFV